MNEADGKVKGVKRSQAIAVIVLGAVLSWLLLFPAGSTELVVVDIPAGKTGREIASIMKKAGLLRSGLWFRALIRITGQPLKAGEYGFRLVTPWGLVRAMQSGKVLLHRVLVKEGDSIYQVAEAFAPEKLCDPEEFLSACTDRETLGRLGVYARSAEGYCFPDTYFFPRGLTPGQMLGKMVERFREAVPDSLADEARARGLTRAQWLVLASIVEKEARVAEERPVIAGVYLNRIRKGMRLEADPTVVYALKHWDKPISLFDLRTDHPYNTYKRRGLPPGPICNPGLSALEAAARPEDVPWLFFVTRKDGTMRHEFTATMADHERAIAESRKRDLDRKQPGR